MRFAAMLSALIAILAVVSPRAALADDDRARFAASFRYVGTSAEQAARKTAIDRGIDSLFFMIRGIARSRLSEGTKIEPWVNFSFEDEKVRVRAPSSDIVSPANGAVVDYRSGNDRTKLSQLFAGGKLTQTFVADGGQRMNEYTLAPDANTLLLKVTVSSPKLTRAVVYTLTYGRVR